MSVRICAGAGGKWLSPSGRHPGLPEAGLGTPAQPIYAERPAGVGTPALQGNGVIPWPGRLRCVAKPASQAAMAVGVADLATQDDSNADQPFIPLRAIPLTK